MRSFNVTSLLRKKRDKQALSEEEIGFLIQEYSKDNIPDYQMSAFLMAAFINGLDDRESAALTREMLGSGKIFDLSEITGKKVDKHSTGGVGDKTSLILAPVVAACGVTVPMISGRGLGHTGGTLDKLESIPGFNVNLSFRESVELLKKHGLVLIGQTKEMAPADKRMYALRDVTATVESIPMICASIMSKKLAEGIDGLVLDVKFGSGAFMKQRSEALTLARKLVAIGEEFNTTTIAYLTDMEQPLGNKVGNWLEVEECIDALQGSSPADLMTLTHRLAGTMIYLGGKAESVEEGIELSEKSIQNGRAMEKFRDIVRDQGGDVSFLDHPETYPKAMEKFEIQADEDGYILGIDTYAIGMAAVELGAGRRTTGDSVDPQAGMVFYKKVGDRVKRGEAMMICHTNKREVQDDVFTLLKKAIKTGPESPKERPLITDTITKENI